MMFHLKHYCFLGLLGLTACQSVPSERFLYPTPEQRDVDFLCTDVYQIPQFQAKPFTRTSPPHLIIITDTTVTVYFSNNQAQTFTKPDGIKVPAGTYRC